MTRNRFDIETTFGGVNVASASATRWGAAVGAGIEYGFSPNWSVGFEYDHLFMGHANNSFSVVNPLVAGAVNRISQDVDMITLRLNYRFGGAAPLWRDTKRTLDQPRKAGLAPAFFVSPRITPPS